MGSRAIVGYTLFENLAGCVSCSRGLIDTSLSDEVKNIIYKNKNSNSLVCSQCEKNLQ